MCIIVAKPMGVKMPTYETLERCFQSNPDGAGFMYADGKTVRIRKGFMELDDFVDAINQEFANEDATEFAIVMHFRITTSGETLPECTHPFPITSDADKIRMLRTESRFAIAHNGVIHGRNTHKGWSDTMDFVAGIVAPLARMNANFMRNDDALELLENACGSKLCILDNSGEIATVGNFIEDDGVLYSNDSYLERVWQWNSYRSVWSDYESAYSSYYNFPNGNEIDELIEMLPFKACQLCDSAEDCVLAGEQCRSEAEAVDACAYYGNMEFDEVLELLGEEREFDKDEWELIAD